MRGDDGNGCLRIPEGHVDQFLQHLLNAVMLGGTYALLGIGLTLIFGIMRVVNFAHGELYAFGAYAVYLIVASLGFLSKLLAEAVEETSMKPVEAVRAAGASFLSVIIMSVMPQVMSRFIGFCAYQLDSNLRNSALVGLVGGGGIGAPLVTAFQRFDYDFVLTIVLAIILIVMLGEIVSGFMRRLFQ